MIKINVSPYITSEGRKHLSEELSYLWLKLRIPVGTCTDIALSDLMNFMLTGVLSVLIPLWRKHCYAEQKVTNSPVHPHGIKVRLDSGEVGRVKDIFG